MAKPKRHRTTVYLETAQKLCFNATASGNTNQRSSPNRHHKRQRHGDKQGDDQVDQEDKAHGEESDATEEEEEEEEQSMRLGYEAENRKLFESSQQLLQQEMQLAGLIGCGLPLGFGCEGERHAQSKKKRKRQHKRFDDYGEEVGMGHAAGLCEEPGQEEEEAEEESTHLDTPPENGITWNYWVQRYQLFSLYDRGIQMDQEGWFSVTPEAIAKYLADRCACDVILDPFAGCGGNVIQFAKTCRHVIAIEKDRKRLQIAKHNAEIYGVAHRIEWIHGDALEILPTLRRNLHSKCQRVDVVFLSPPWGGPGYNRRRFRLEWMKIQQVSGPQLLQIAQDITRNVCYYLPKSTRSQEIEALVPQQDVEVQHVFLNGQRKVVTVFYGNLVRSQQQQQHQQLDQQSHGQKQEDSEQHQGRIDPSSPSHIQNDVGDVC